MIEVTIKGDKPEEVQEMIIFCSGIPTEDTLDEVRADYMQLHGNILRLEKKIPDANKMFDSTYEKVKKMMEEIDGKDTPKQKSKGKQTRKGNSETLS